MSILNSGVLPVIQEDPTSWGEVATALTNASDAIDLLNAGGINQTSLNSNTTLINSEAYRVLEGNKGFRWNPRDYTTWYKNIRTMESTETWTAVSGTATADTTAGEFIQGTQAIKLINSGASGTGVVKSYSDVTLDLTKFADGSTSSELSDYKEFNIFISDATLITGNQFLWFYTTTAGARFNDRAYNSKIATSYVTGWNQVRIRKTSFIEQGTFSNSWASIIGIYFYFSTTSTAFYAVIDSVSLIKAPLSPSDKLWTSSASNSDRAIGTSLILADSTHIPVSLFSTPYQQTKLLMNNTDTNAKGREYTINSIANGTITCSATLPTITNNVLWEIVRPQFVQSTGSFTWMTEGTNSLFKLGCLYTTSSVDKFLSIHSFRPRNPNYNYWLKAHFELIANSSKQGFAINYVDSSNMIKIYLTHSNSTTSTIIIDEVIAGVTTNKYTSSNFTTANADEIILMINVQGDRIDVYKSDVNDYTITLVKSLMYYNSALITNKYNIYCYSDKAFRMLEFYGADHIEKPEMIFYKVTSGTFATASTLTVVDTNIHKTSKVTFTLKSAPVGNIYISNIGSGQVTFTSSSASETAQLKIEVWN